MKKVITHNGRFHTDETFGVAVLRLALDEPFEVIRTRDDKVITTGDIVLDIGGVYDPGQGRFDHHQKGGAGEHANGIPYSSFGLVWKKYGVQLCGTKEAANIVKKRLVYPIDATDNGVDTFVRGTRDDLYPYLMHSITMSFRPAWNEEGRTPDAAFLELVDIAVKILSREIVHAKAYGEAKKKVEEAYERSEDKRIIVLDGPYPWEEVLSGYSEPLFMVGPKSQSSNWNVKTVRSEVHSFKSRKDLPAAWAGKRGEELAQITGVPDAIFCHNGRFIAVAGSKEGALRLAWLALEHEE
ncbi:MAG: MYG1 family protein [Patescibacteria group bacterium]|nr:MAG: MYG1 family protein [Patescibacteria group bacterium]